MSYEALAIQMKHHGCPINASALFRIEKGDPPRRITVDEFVAFSEVFGIPVDQLLLPPEVAASKELVALVVAWNNAREAALSAQVDERAEWGRLTEYVNTHPEISDSVETVMQTWVEHYFDEDRRNFAFAHWMWDLTKAPEWADRVKEALEDEIGPIHDDDWSVDE